uniref:Tight junction protein ZO-1 n=1 Tax=Eptatretus burgeri TaxID=7764 RepID=A0A8C4RBQ0_EPTBU
MSYGGVAFKKSSTMEETVIWEQHTVNLHRAPNIGFGVAVSGGRDNPHFQSGETSIVISDVLQGSPADGLLEENDRVMMVNGVAMDNVEHAFAVQQLRKSGKTVQLTVRRKRLVQLPLGRQQSPPLRRHGMEDEYSTGYGEDEDLDRHSNYSDRSAGRSGRDGRRPRRRDDGGGERREGGMGRRRERSRGSPSRSRSRGRSASLGSLRSVSPNRPPRPLKVMLVKSKPTEGYGLRLGSHIYVKDIGGDGLAARDGSIQEGDIVLKINGTVTENMSLADARKLIEKSKGKLRLVVQRDERKTLTNMPELDDSLPSSEDSDRDDISDIHSLHSDHSNQDQPLADDHSRSPHSAGQGSGLSDKAGDQPEETRKNDAGHKMLKMGAIPTPFVTEQDWVPSPKVVEESKAVHVEDKATPPPDPKPVFAQSGQPDVDLPVSPTEGYQPQDDDQMFSPTVKLIRFCKGDSVGLRLAGGNDVGIFVAGVTTGSPAAQQGLQEGDQILGVNNVDFRNIVREEAVLYLLDLPKGEEVTVHAQRKRDVYQRIVESDVGDSFYIRTHFDYEKESPYGLTFSRGEVFRVVDTLYNGKLGSWLAIRIGKNNQEVERGIIPNKNRAEQLATVQNTSKMSTSDRADFWRIRGLRAGKKNLRKSREDLSVQPVPTKFPAYERVVLREAGFLRPVVVLGPIADVSREKLSREQPDLYEIARCEPRDAGMDQKSAGVIRLHTIKEIIDKDKHALLDITPGAVDRLNYAQWYPIVVFLNPDSKSGVKTMRQRLTPESHKSSRKLHERAVKLRKNNWHLFTAVVNLNSMNEGWYGALKDVVTEQQNQLVWVSEGRADIEAEDLDLQDDRISHLSAPLSELSLYSDSRHTSDFEDTDTEGGTYTDQELDESVNERETEILPVRSAVSRSSEPVDEELPYGYRPEHPVAPVSTHSQQVPAYDTHQFLHQRVEAKRESPVLRHSSPPQEMSVRVPAGAMTDPRWGQGEPVPLPRVQMDSLEEHRTSPDPQVLPPRQWSPEMVAPKPRLPRSNSREMLAELSHTSRQSEMSRVPTQGDVSISQVGVTDLQPASVQEPQVQASRTLEALRPANRYEQDEEARPEVYRQQQSYYPRSEQDHGVMPSAGPPSGRVDQLADSAHGLTSNQLSSRPRSAEEDGLDARSSRLPEKHAEPSTGPQNRYGPPTYPKPAILQKPAISAPAPPLQPKPELPAAASKPLLRNVVRDDITRPAQPPINGAGPLAYKPNPTPFGNRFTTTGAKPFQKKFDSPKFNHNLPEDGNGKEPSTGHTYSLDPVNGSSIVPRQQEFARSSYQTDNLTVAPKAIPVSSSVLEDESHTVLATARGVFDGHGGVLSSVETGVSIIIPKGAIADGTEQEIYFKVCKDNSILPPLDKEKGETLLSPLVMCGPHGLKFQKPVELRLPHCEPSNWQKAGDPNHKGSNCVSVLIDHF